MAQPVRESASITAQNTFSNPVYVNPGEEATLSLTGTWTATVTVQYRPGSGDGSGTWIDLDTETANGRWCWKGGGDDWRFGVKTGGFGNGTVVGTIQGNSKPLTPQT